MHYFGLKKGLAIVLAFYHKIIWSPCPRKTCETVLMPTDVSFREQTSLLININSVEMNCRNYTVTRNKAGRFNQGDQIDLFVTPWAIV
jgi:hypothetical protein